MQEFQNLQGRLDNLQNNLGDRLDNLGERLIASSNNQSIRIQNMRATNESHRLLPLQREAAVPNPPPAGAGAVGESPVVGHRLLIREYAPLAAYLEKCFIFYHSSIVLQTEGMQLLRSGQLLAATKSTWQ